MSRFHPTMVFRLFTTMLVHIVSGRFRASYLFLFQAVERFGVVRRDHCQFFAAVRFGTRAAGGVATPFGAQPYRAQRLAEWRFGARNSAARAVYHFGRDFHVVQFRPMPRHFLAQTVVVVDCGPTRFALLAIQSAIGNKICHNKALTFYHYRYKNSRFSLFYDML